MMTHNFSGKKYETIFINIINIWAQSVELLRPRYLHHQTVRRVDCSALYPLLYMRHKHIGLICPKYNIELHHVSSEHLRRSTHLPHFIFQVVEKVSLDGMTRTVITSQSKEKTDRRNNNKRWRSYLCVLNVVSRPTSVNSITTFLLVNIFFYVLLLLTS